MKSVVLSVAGDVMVESGARLWWRLAWPRLSCNVPGPVLVHSCLTSTIPPTPYRGTLGTEMVMVMVMLLL